MSTRTVVEARPRPIASASASPPLATALLAALALAKLALHFAGVTRYGFFRDELYYMACGEHLAWGYVDQPPLIAFIAWTSQHLFGDSIISMRLLPILAGAALIFLTGRLARELGGGRFAQSLAALAILIAPAFLAFDSFLSMNAFEPVFWTVCAWLTLRIVNGGDQRLWLLAGAVAGLGLLNKHTLFVFGFALVCGLLLSGEQRRLRSKWIWLGAFLAFVIFLPNLLWEAHHGWPQIEVVRNAQRFKNVPLTPLRFLWEQVLFLHPLALPVWLGGIGWYFFNRAGKRYRFLAWAFLLTLAIFIGFHGKSYYVLPAYPLLLAAGGVAFERAWQARRERWLRVAYPSLLVLGGLLTVPFGVPVLPLRTFLHYQQVIPLSRSVKTERDATVPLPQLYADMLGWENMAVTVARVYGSLPPEERARCAILAGNYGEAGAIDFFGPRYGLPKALSGHNSYFFWGPRAYSGECVILFGERSQELRSLFGESQLAAVIHTPDAMPIEQDVPVYLCRRPRAPLRALWPRFRMII